MEQLFPEDKEDFADRFLTPLSPVEAEKPARFRIFDVLAQEPKNGWHMPETTNPEKTQTLRQEIDALKSKSGIQDQIDYATPFLVMPIDEACEEAFFQIYERQKKLLVLSERLKELQNFDILNLDNVVLLKEIARQVERVIKSSPEISQEIANHAPSNLPLETKVELVRQKLSKEDLHLIYALMNQYIKINSNRETLSNEEQESLKELNDTYDAPLVMATLQAYLKAQIN